MANMFERLAARSRQVVERVHGTAITVYPVSADNVNAPPTISVDTPSWDTVGCFFQNTMMESELKAHPSADGRRTLHRAPQREVSIRLVEGRTLKTGDRIKRIKDGSWFSVGPFNPDGLGNVIAFIAPCGALET